MNTANVANVAIESLEPNFKNYCKTKWNGSGEEIAQTSLTCLLIKISKKKFEHKSLEQTDFMLKRLAKATARKVCGYKYSSKKTEKEYQSEFYTTKIKGTFSSDQSLNELLDRGWEPTPARPATPNSKLEAILSFLSPALKVAVEAVLQGFAFEEAAELLGMTSASLSQKLKVAGEQFSGLAKAPTSSNPRQQGLFEVAI